MELLLTAAAGLAIAAVIRELVSASAAVESFPFPSTVAPELTWPDLSWPSIDWGSSAWEFPQMLTPTTLSSAGLDLIKRYEGLRLTAYRDPGGTWTIGYGHTGADVYQGLAISAARADELLRADVTWAEGVVRQSVQVALTQNQFDALVSFVFNVGAGAFTGSTLLQKLNALDYDGAAAEFSRWTYAGGQQLAGLINRRTAEAALFAS